MIRRTLRALRWPYALAIALWACGVPALRFDASAPDATLTCEQSCARRADAGCLEPALAARCVPTCEHVRAAGMYAPDRCRP